MPSWHSLLEDVKVRGSVFDVVRREWLAKLAEYTGRNIIIYYSGWLQKSGIQGLQVNDADKNGLMTVIHGLDRSKGLDLLLHTPGGETAATESIVDYLHAMFGTDIRAIVPQLALSAGTMIACACKEIVMGKQSSLGPVDPQFNGIPAHGIVEEFRRAYQEIRTDPAKIAVWQPVIAKYHPTGCGSHNGHCCEAARTAMRSGRSVSSMAGSQRSLRARARSWTICWPVSSFQRAPQRFIRISNRLLHVASTLPLPSGRPRRRARA